MEGQIFCKVKEIHRIFQAAPCFGIFIRNRKQFLDIGNNAYSAAVPEGQTAPRCRNALFSQSMQGNLGRLPEKNGSL